MVYAPGVTIARLVLLFLMLAQSVTIWTQKELIQLMIALNAIQDIIVIH